MQNLKLFLFANILILSLKSAAYTPKEGNVSAMLGPYVYQTVFSGSATGVKSPYLGGFGLIIMGDVSDYGNLEISVFHMNKIYYREPGDDFLAEKTQLVHISMGYRYWFNPYFSSALAFSSAYAIGDPTIVSSNIAPGHQVDTSARDLTEYGFDLSIQSQLWANNVMAIVLDGRYSLSVTSKVHEHADHFGFLLGLRYFVQEKQVHERPKTSPKS
jgi:hypothetical protein